MHRYIHTHLIQIYTCIYYISSTPWVRFLERNDMGMNRRHRKEFGVASGVLVIDTRIRYLHTR